MKKCNKCLKEKELKFYYKKKGMRDGYRNDCKDCEREYHKHWYTKNSEKQKSYNKDWEARNTQHRKSVKLKRIYGITLEQYETMLKNQNNVCAICGSKFAKICVDHCHTTGKIRGLLCDLCNRGIGHFKDSPELLLKAHKYLL